MMMRSLTLLLAVMLTCCTTTAQTKELDGIADGTEQNLPISRMSTDFLYLAAVQAMENDNPSLAVGFLKALVEKDPDAVLPRMQLAEILLQGGRAAEAREPVNELLSMSELSDEIRNNVRMLQVQLLVLDDKHDEAIENLQAILRDAPDAYPARLMLVRLLTASKRIADAQRSIADGLKYGQSPQLYHIQAQLYIREGKFGKAEKSLNTLMQLEPDESGPVLMFSQLALRLNKPVKAENVLRHHLVNHPEAMGVSNALGRLLVEQNRGKEAIAIYEDIAERTGGNPDVLIALGLLHYQGKDFEQAADIFRRVLKQKNDSRAAFYLAACLESLGQKDKARDMYQRIKNDDENFAVAQLRMAAMDLRADRIDAALVALRQLIRSEPNMADAYSLLSAALMRKKAYRNLLDETEPALSLQNVPVQLLFNRAAAFEGLKQYNEAAGQIKKLFTIDPDNIEALNFLGYLYAEQGVQLDEAEKLIRRALKKRPDNGYYLDSLAWVHYKRAEYDKALAVQREAIDQVPNDPVMREHLGDMLWKSGKPDEARATWKDAIKLGHEDRRSMQHKIDKGL
jgi:tetratricopeptide (TPR) repeat protein